MDPGSRSDEAPFSSSTEVFLREREDHTKPEKRKVGAYTELPDEQITAVAMNGTRIALYKTQGKILATAEMCTHDECSLEDFGKIQGENVECTCHGAMFKITTGEVTRGPATVALKTYRVDLVEDEIWIEL